MTRRYESRDAGPSRFCQKSSAEDLTGEDMLGGKCERATLPN